MYIAF